MEAVFRRHYYNNKSYSITFQDIPVEDHICSSALNPYTEEDILDLRVTKKRSVM